MLARADLLARVPTRLQVYVAPDGTRFPGPPVQSDAAGDGGAVGAL